MPEESAVKRVADYFGCNVFNEDVMRDRLPKNIYKSLKNTMDNGVALTAEVADVVANAMKDWAIEKGATHYTHWFQPMTGITAEKHDAFLTPVANDKIIMEFRGKELIKGEPDASSFPSAGLRSTFEARGYTAWDPTSYAFIKGKTLYIPTAFCSYSGEVLDKKTPLLRSMEVINEQALRLLRLFGNTTATRVITTCGPEQEYFLVDKKLYDKRKDLIFAGRTLFGAKALKGQELEDHYFGNLKRRVANYMYDLDEALWKLGVFAKTKHNEAAPAQHELAPVFTTSNLAADHNQLTMELMKNIAVKHDLYCLLQEKPFEGVNGSGKHNNWSLSTNDGQNLFEPGKSPQQNIQFITFLCAVIKAVDENADLLRISVASAGNDHRLGGNEAPPPIISIFLGDELTAILESLETGKYVKSGVGKQFEIGVEALPNFPKDTTDRNRTSPFAFTGNKFEFRMLGSADSISCTNIIMNTIVAEVFCEFADKLENAEDFGSELNEILIDTFRAHRKVIFNGNNYSQEWADEAERRGLPNYPTTVDCLPHYTDEKNIRLFEKHKVYTATEVESRKNILLDNYSKSINIEGLTMVDMARKEIVPAVIKYSNEVCDSIIKKNSIGMTADAEKMIVGELTDNLNPLVKAVADLDSKLNADKPADILENAKYYKDVILPAMDEVRKYADNLEVIVSEEYWPFPTYSELLFNI